MYVMYGRPCGATPAGAGGACLLLSTCSRPYALLLICRASQSSEMISCMTEGGVVSLIMHMHIMSV